MIVYDITNNSHVAILVSWWSSLSDEDRANLFYPTLHKLGPFLHFFESAPLMFAIDTRGITVAAWTEPMFDGALFSLYVRPDCRRAPSAWREVEQAYAAAFEVHSTLVGQTRQPTLHALHLKMGYLFAGRLNKVFKGGPVYFYELTREAWQSRREAAMMVRQSKRRKREQHGATAPMENNNGARREQQRFEFSQ